MNAAVSIDAVPGEQVGDDRMLADLGAVAVEPVLNHGRHGAAACRGPGLSR